MVGRIALAAVLLIPRLACPADIHVEVVRHGASFEVRAKAELEADVAQVWDVLTDYERLPEFIPDLRSSRVLARSSRSAVVEQEGRAQLLFFIFPISVRYGIEEFPCKSIIARATSGNLKELHGTYLLDAHDHRVTLTYNGWLTPAFDFPPLIGTMLLRNEVEKQFGAMVDEILRRKASPPRPSNAEPFPRGQCGTLPPY